MADTKTSDLTLATTIDAANDQLMVVAGGANKRAAVSLLFENFTVDASAVASGTLAAARLPTTGLSIDAWKTSVGTATDAATVTFDLSAKSNWKLTLGGDRTLALSSATASSRFTLILKQDATGSRTVTWFGGILWPGGTAPTLTTTAGKYDVFTFITLSSGVYLGFVAGQNF